MKTFYFGGGPRHDGEQRKIEAVSLRRAIRMFRVGTSFPHTYSNKRVKTEVLGENGHRVSTYLSSEPGGMVEVWALEPSKENPHRMEQVKLAEISPDPPEGEEGFQAVQSLLAQDGSPSGSLSTALVPAGALTGLGALTRKEMDNKQLELHRMMGELEQQKRILFEQVAAIKAELTRRLEQVWLIELFLGSKEEVRVLREGAPAPVETRIAVRQQILCMDEEIAVHDWLNNPERIGDFDFSNIGDFDKWLLADASNLESVCPWAKGIVGLRVRRNAKDRSYLGFDLGSAMERATLEEADTMVYVLIRNGENLYRLWVDVNLWPRFFASESDLLIKDESWRFFEEKKIQSLLKIYAAGLVMVAGILQRSTLLHPLPKVDLNPFDGRDVDAHFLLVRDAEDQKVLGDGRAFEHLTWKSYEAWLKEQLAEGVRVTWTGKPSHNEKDELWNRTGVRSMSCWPSNKEIYTLDTWNRSSNWHGYTGSFMYRPTARLWKRGEDGDYAEVDRARRVRFSIYSDEILPVDFVSWRVLEALIRDRSQRDHYSEFFKYAFRWYKMKRAEAEAERPFIDLVLSRCAANLNSDDHRARCERLLRWWKLKTRENRSLGTDEAKALRMIEAAFLRGDDHENDPEVSLMRGRQEAR